MTTALDRAGVAQLIVTRSDGQYRGSGYRIAAGWVLTAAHVVADAVAVRVVFEPDLPGERAVDGLSWDCDGDVAVVAVAADEELTPVAFGSVGDGPAVLEAQAVGFPRWKLRTEGDRVYRDSYHGQGTVAALSNWREGTLELRFPVAPDGSWEGMSGAAVWIGDRIVGVVSEHHPGDGLGQLAVARLDRARRFFPRRLPSVIALAPSALAVAAYREEVTAISPARLEGRHNELDELARFCAGDESYTWWQGPPWAGKSALMSWFVLHPPAGVDVVPFFVTSRLLGQSDSSAYVESLIRQLAALVGDPEPAGLEVSARHGYALRLLRLAAERCAAAGRRLLLVVDGLDEDTSRRAGVDRPSIASLLPRRPFPSLRVLVASRPHPELPTDVPGDHPLRKVRPRLLKTWSMAHHLERVARNELASVLIGPPAQREVLGLITASGGGLTFRDLEEISGLPPYELDGLFLGLLGRSVNVRMSRPSKRDEPLERVYLFAHETLREIAVQQFGQSISGYRDRLHAWVDGYAVRGWPVGTPTYAMRGYSRMLAAAGDRDRSLRLTTDSARHERMREYSGGDGFALGELASAYDLIAGQEDPDFDSLLLLALHRDELTDRNRDLPTGLPAIWATLGQMDRAMALVNSIGDPARYADAMNQVAAAVAATGDLPHARRLLEDARARLSDIVDPRTKARTLADFAITMAAIGDPEAAVPLAKAVEAVLDQADNPWATETVVGAVAIAWAAAGDHERSEQFAQRVTMPENSIYLRSRFAMIAAAAGDQARATESAAAAVAAFGVRPDMHTRPEALEALVDALVAAGSTAELAALAETVSNAHEDPKLRAAAALATVLAAAGKLDHAEDLARRIDGRRLRSSVFVTLARAPGNDVRARDLAVIAERVARTSDAHGGRPVAVAIALVAQGDLTRAIQLTDVADDRAYALTYVTNALLATGNGVASLAALVEAGARESGDSDAYEAAANAWIAAGELDRAQVATQLITNRPAHASTVGKVAAAIAVAGDIDRAEQLVSELSESDGRRAGALATLASAVADDRERAFGLALAAEISARNVTSSFGSWALSEVATAWVAVGELDRAEGIGLELVALGPDTPSLNAVACALAPLGDRAERFVRQITDPEARSRTLAALSLAVIDDRDRAERIVGEITVPGWRVRPLAELARHTQSGELAKAAEAAAREVADPASRAELLVEIALRNLAGSSALVVEVLGTSHWSVALSAVPLAAAQRLADVLLARSSG